MKVRIQGPALILDSVPDLDGEYFQDLKWKAFMDDMMMTWDFNGGNPIGTATLRQEGPQIWCIADVKSDVWDKIKTPVYFALKGRVLDSEEINKKGEPRLVHVKNALFIETALTPTPTVDRLTPVEVIS